MYSRLDRCFAPAIFICGAGLFTALVVLVTFVVSARGDTVALHPVADTTIAELSPANFGGGTTFTVGGRRKGGATRGLLQFKVATNIPSGSTITSASLSLTDVEVPSGAIGSIFELHRVLAAWGEGTGNDHGGSVPNTGEATWTRRMFPTSWTNPGGDFSATISATQAVGGFGTFTFASNPQLVADVQDWLNNPDNNFGWLVRSQSEGTPVTIRRLASRLDTNNWPSLVVDYSPPTLPAKPPVFRYISVQGTSAVIGGTNGTAGAPYYVMTSTNLTLPLANWTRLATNTFDANGNFEFTNTTVLDTLARFYLLQLP